MSATTMHFGPEWMRTKHQPLSRQQPPSPPLSANNASATYSALVSATQSMSFDTGTDESHPFRYSKEELLKIYQEGGGKGGLGLEVERWEGVVREGGTDPVTLREMTEAEKKLFAGPLNSELRRRPSQSAEYLSPLNTSLERPRLNHASSSANANSPLRERFGALKRRDSASDMLIPALGRKPSLTALQTPLLSPREANRSRGNYTPGFDGVLNNGESWVSRRRASETANKSGSISTKDAIDMSQDIKTSGIQEEKEEDHVNNEHPRGESDAHFFSASSQSSPEKRYDAGSSGNGQDTSQQNMLLSNADPFASTHVGVGPPPGLVDLAAIEWSYKDPTGQIQGPFRADLMQKWYNDGYFAGDLPMKRTRYDAQWTTVAELVQRSNGENIFLSPIPSLNTYPHASTPGGHVYSLPDQAYIEPLQPAPIRSLRTSTLESYVNAGSESPSSSVGAPNFGNPSPDSSAFAGWDNKGYYGGDPTSRLAGFGMPDRPSPYSERRVMGHEFQSGLNNASYNHYVPERDLAYGGYGYTNVSNINQLADANQLQQRHPELTNNISLARTFSSGVPQINGQTNFAGNPVPTDTNSPNFLNYNYTGQPSFQNSPIQQQQYALPLRASGESHISPMYSFRDPNDDIVSTQSPRSLAPNVSAAVPVPWGEPEPSVPKPSEEPESFVEPAPVSNTAWDHNEGDSTSAVDSQAPVVRQTVIDEATLPTGETVSHATLGSTAQRTQQKEQLHKPESSTRVAPESQVESTPRPPVPASQPSTKKHTQTNVSSSQPQTSQQPISPQTTDSLPTTPSVPKMAWAKDEDNKKKAPAASSVSLRDIQEAEARKLESRKAAEREKERAARAAASESKEDLQPFIASWGLPTSQAGSRGTALPRETVGVPTQAPAAPVWTTTVKPVTAKKTMKEIQEEEEVRKKALSKEAVVASTPKRPYADTTIKTSATVASSGNGNNVWTTVGPSGKANPIVAAASGRPSQASTPTLATSAATARPAAPPVQRVGSATSKPKHPAVKQDDFPEPPSHDFLKWLSDSLKGLNASVNVEEIVSMLLSFPLEPDATTTEIISDTIYSNSTTLDGRRFASEFVAKRKADAVARAKGGTSSGKVAGKPISIADVVKATPKASQPEWGFKVVNKKKKGNRA
ncbi:hypothetical protein CPC08DRAFT_677685 [Agrocybe pediades]|nr:hypothetical protein CPC08DRAFT_677685 [Agrocybe pediades]